MKASYEGRKHLGERCESFLRSYGVEIVPLGEAPVAFSVLGTHIYSTEEIASVPCGIVNLHLAPLPDYRGFYAFSHAVANHEKKWRVTLHYVDEGIDTGPVIGTEAVKMSGWPRLLATRSEAAGYALFCRWAPWILGRAASGDCVHAEPQPPGGHYYGRDSLPPEALTW